MDKALVILCGGDSSRMGTDKALLPFGKECLLSYMVHKFEPYFDHIYLSVNTIGEYEHLNLNVKEIPDIYLNAGPIGAIFSSLSMIHENRAFFVSIDTPFMDPQTGLFLLEHSIGYDACSFEFSHFHFDIVANVYSKKCLSSLGKFIMSKNVTYNNFLSRCYTNYIAESNFPRNTATSLENQFFLLNDRESYYYALMYTLFKESL